MYSAVIADCIFRYQKLRQTSTKYLFSTGTDEHGAKVAQAATQNGQPVEKYCTAISNKYKELFDKTNIQYTHFNRTTDSEKHLPAVQHFWVIIISLNLRKTFYA